MCDNILSGSKLDIDCILQKNREKTGKFSEQRVRTKSILFFILIQR